MNAPELYEEKIYTHKNATLSKNSKGRKYKLKKDDYRTDYQRDVNRITYSQPFRRLRHKTQVFFLVNNDHVCSRLEHSLYVSHASRTVARNLRLNEDLAEAIGLGHDLGHAPFGHHGEKILGEIAKENDLDIIFQHETHALRVVDSLGLMDRHRKPGLNLTYEVRDGIISHNGESFEKERELIPYKGEKKLEEIKSRVQAGFPTTLEGCIVRIVDKISYVGRDLEDGLRAGLIEEIDIPEDITKALGSNNEKIVGTLLNDLIAESSKYNDKICISEEKYEFLCKLKDFNYEKIYKTKEVEKYKKHATELLKVIYNHLCEDLKKSELLTNRRVLPEANVYDILDEFIKDVRYKKDAKIEKIVFDFVAGMTDNYVVNCLDEIFKPKAVV